ncbi:hypothetical protein H4R18_004597 [Coemansia javaensis]|uniref:mRNA m(6)A methyltransferase n=1 Tax=Coemansia javaensis TaxID=2761396 RepID=A0A9W8HAA8_9FUNG|nr:hypothetical protein H4R18_004597 [Coemansia javaensis]
MWQDEPCFEDDDAAMAAYEEAVGGRGKGCDSDDSDDDFEPATRKARSAAQRPPAPRGRRPAGGARKPRAAPAPAPAPAPSDAVSDSAQSAIPTPDIGQLQVSSSLGGSPRINVDDDDDDDRDDDKDDEAAALAALREREQAIRARMAQLEKEIAELERKCGVEGARDGGAAAEEMDLSEFRAPEWSVPIRANVMNFEWEKLAAACQFDVILMDPPWQLASQAPTRGVAIAYQQLPDVCIESLPIHLLQTSGFIFIWVINNKYTRAFQLMKQWGYTYVDDVAWVKQTVNRRMAKGHGYYLQHAKETCLVGKKGADPPNLRRSVASDVIFSERRGQSQKPEEMYEIIEQLVPGGRYLEIFGRKNNLRDYWVTIGNEL